MIEIHDKTFEPYLSENEIQRVVNKIAKQLEILANKNPLFIVILKGAFLFASDLLKALSFDAEVTFMQLDSYDGLKCTGKIKELMSINENLNGRTLVVVEDIIDTGLTIDYVRKLALNMFPKSVEIGTLLLKKRCR